ncbi:MAG: SRPBCC domain-containing protein [Alphaproteobacteria bacterium]|nr:SRPBCC domain-containing protein [Alphaproteobacteria bacterium]
MTTDTLSLTINRHFDAPPEQVFDAWLGKAWGEWIGPRDIRGEVTALEPKVGGQYRIRMHKPDGTTLAVGGVYREIVRPSKLVFTWVWEEGQTDTLITLTFRKAGHGTDMTIRHEGFADADRRDRHNSGWTSSFEKLAERLAREGV